MFLKLCELEQQLLNLGKGVNEELRYITHPVVRAREAGRATGFFASAHMISEQIEKGF